MSNWGTERGGRDRTLELIEHVEHQGALIRRRRIDLYIPDCAAAREFGRRSVHVAVVRRAQ